MSKLPDLPKSPNSSKTAYPQGNANRGTGDVPIHFGESVRERGAGQSISRVAQSPSFISSGSSSYTTSGGSQYTGPPPSSVSGYASNSGFRPADRPKNTANVYSSPHSPPWKFRPDFGDFVYKRSTDQIIRPNSQPQPRPSHVSADSLSWATWEGFQSTESPPMPAIQSGFQPPVGGLQASQVRTGQMPQGRQSVQARSLPVGSRRPSSSMVQEMGQGSRIQPNDFQTTEFQQNGQSLRHAFDPRTGTATLSAVPGQTQSQRSGGQASNPHQRLGDKGENRDILHSDYKLHPAKFFKVGRVFLVLWAEPAGKDGKVDSVIGASQSHLGQQVISKIRRFVVVREGAQSCHALPISTYNGQGVSKPRVVKSDHAIIHTGPTAPSASPRESPGRGEAPMRPIAIRVDLDSASEKLDPMSRINFGGIHMVQHNVKTKSLGFVNRNSLGYLQLQFDSVFKQRSMATGPISDRGRAPNNDGESEEDGEDDDEVEDEEESEEDEEESEDGEVDDDEADDDNEAASVDGEDEDEDEDETEGNAAEEDSDSDDE
jgi:hypothetical protein